MKQRPGSRAEGWVGEEVGYIEVIRYGKGGVKKRKTRRSQEGKKVKKGADKMINTVTQ